MDPYAKPKERKVGGQRPKITHLPRSADTRTRRERQDCSLNWRTLTESKETPEHGTENNCAPGRPA